MANIKPISDLRSYTTVLDEVAQGSPVFLTKNGRGRYVILDISDYERHEAEKTLLTQLDYGKRVADERGGSHDRASSRHLRRALRAGGLDETRMVTRSGG